jgi:hypothetical protein
MEGGCLLGDTPVFSTLVGTCFGAYKNSRDGLEFLFPKLTWDKKQLVVGPYWGAVVVHQHHIPEASFKLTLELGREIGLAFYPGFFEAVEQDYSFPM